MTAWTRWMGALVMALPGAAGAAVKPPGWGFPGADLLLGAGAAVILVLAGRALAAPARRSEASSGQRRDA